MSIHSKRASRLCKQYDIRLRLDDEKDKDAAVEYAVAKLFPLYSEDAQADVFAMVRECFDKYPAGIGRRIAVTTQLQRYTTQRIRGR